MESIPVKFEKRNVGTDRLLGRSLAETATAEAAGMGIAVAVSVVDNGGHLVYFARMDGTSFLAAEVTRRKAVTSVAFRMPTSALAMVADSDPSIAADLAKNPDICMIAGGIPLRINGQIVGALGVAGGRAEQDKAIAEKAAAVLSDQA